MRLVWRDLLFNLLGSLLVVFVLVLVLINDPKDAEQEDIVRDRLVVDLYWGPPVGKESDRDTDVDLWVTGPADVRPVGYSNRMGTQFALTRDILSRRSTLAPINHEQSGAQFIVPGQYTVNVHLFRLSDKSPLPIRVQVVVYIDGKSVLTRVVDLLFNGHEVTVFNFDLDSEGVVSNVGHYQRPLRDR